MAGDIGYPFKQARWYEKGRGGYDIRWIVWHATDDEERPTYAEGLGNYFATTERRVSTHFGVDSDSAMQYVKILDTAYGAGSPANYRGIHIEHSGEAGQTRAEWLDPFGQGLFRQSAELNARLHRLTGIPFRGRFLTDDELRARVPGTTRHMDLVRVFGGTHATCPSLNFPSDVLFDLIEQRLGDLAEDDMDQNSPVTQALDVPIGDIAGGTITRPLRWWLSAPYAHVIGLEGRMDDLESKLDQVIGLLSPKEPE